MKVQVKNVIDKLKTLGVVPLRWRASRSCLLQIYSDPLLLVFMSWCKGLDYIVFVTQATKFGMLAIVLFGLKVFFIRQFGKNGFNIFNC